MSEFQVEPLNGGLVSARPAALMQPGELVSCGGMYRPYSQSLWNAPINGSFASGGGGANLTGARYLGFDYLKVPIALTNGTTTITPIGSATFAGISVGATVRGDGIAEGTTVAAKASNTSMTLSTTPVQTSTPTATFDADHVVVVQDTGNSKYRVATATNTTSTLSDLATSISTGTNLDSVAYNNRHVLLNGRNANLVVLPNQTTRAHGLKPVVATPTATVGSGTWALDDGIGFYSYWTTEYDKTNDVESDFQGKPAIVNITTTAQQVTVQRGPRVNPSATHWRLYRSVKMTASSLTEANAENIFPNGNFVCELELKDDGTNLTVIDGGSAVSSTSALAAGSVGIVGIESTAFGASANTWTTTSNATGASNATFAVLQATTGGGHFAQEVLLELGTFGLSGITAPVTGITVVVTGKKTANAELSVGLYSTNTPGVFDYFQARQLQSTYKKTVPLTTSNASYTLGSSSDDWSVGYDASAIGWQNFRWIPADFANGKFVVRLYGKVPNNGDAVSVDSVTVSVSYGNSQQAQAATPFPALTVEAFDVTTSVGRNGPPPKATTGDIFQDSLVLNDVTIGNYVWYSFPGNIDAFPTVYFINFNTQEQDVVTCIKAVGNALVVGMNGRLWRLTYLPRASDAEFDRGRCVEPLDNARGIVGPLAATRFTNADGQQMLAFFSGKSLDMTDGYRITPITNDIDFTNLIDPAFLSQTVVVDNPKYSELWLVYVPKGTSTMNGVRRFSYHPTHIKQDGSLKCSAGTIGTARAVAPGLLRTGVRVQYVTDGTDLFRANQLPTSSVSIPYITRTMHLAGMGKAAKLIQMYTHYTQYGYSAASLGTISHTIRGHRAGGAAPIADADYYRVASAVTNPLLAYPTGTATDPKDQRIIKTSHNFGDNGLSDSAALSASGATFDFSIDFTVWEYEPLKDEYIIYG